MERINGEIRDGEKTIRSLKKVDTPILKGMRIIIIIFVNINRSLA
jgi:hypothetical protein